MGGIQGKCSGVTVERLDLLSIACEGLIANNTNTDPLIMKRVPQRRNTERLKSNHNLCVLLPNYNIQRQNIKGLG